MKQNSPDYSTTTKISFFILALGISFSAYTSNVIQYDFNPRCVQAYNEIIKLNFQSGEKLLNQEKTINPGNKIPVFLENYIDFLTLVIGEEQTEFEALKPNRSDRISILTSGESNSPWHRHCLAAVYLQWSFIQVKFGEYIMAGLDLNRAYRLLEQNRLKHPGFVPDLLLSGVMNALIGSIPENYKWVTRLIGMDGAVETGRSKLYKLIEIADANPEWAHLKSEAFFYLSFIERNLQSDKSHAASLLQKMQACTDLAAGSLNCYIMAKLSMRIGKNDKAIEILENCNIPDGSHPFHYLEFVLGSAKLRGLEQDASKHFLNFVNHYQGSNYIKSAYQRLAWLSLLKGDRHAYRFYMSQVLEHGSLFVDGDKQAQAEAAEKNIPNKNLLKARLLFDGGYHEAALGSLDNADLLGKKDSVEYLYRKARIYHEWGNILLAKKHYQKTIDQGSYLKYFFAGNAALHLGQIYENDRKYGKAVYYYDLCLNLQFTEYRSSIHQKARIGRQRVKK